MDDQERRLQIALRLKAARHLRGHLGKKGATAMHAEDVARLPAAIDEGITENRITDIEQMRGGPPKRSELVALIEALALPAGWFDGLYASAPGEAVSDSLGDLLLRTTEAVQEQRRVREEAAASSGRRGRRVRTAGGDVG